MIKEFVEAWERNKHELEAKFQQKHPEDYDEILRGVLELFRELAIRPHPRKFHRVADGDYNGTLVFVIPQEEGDDFWYVKIAYGTSWCCDTLEYIKKENQSDPPNEDQVKMYMTLALHIVQRLKLMDAEVVGED